MNHIISGSTLVHNDEDVYDEEYLVNMALINNICSICSWLKRYIALLGLE